MVMVDKFPNILSFSEINATGFNYQNEDEKVTLSFPSTLQNGKWLLPVALRLVVPALFYHCLC